MALTLRGIGKPTSQMAKASGSIFEGLIVTLVLLAPSKTIAQYQFGGFLANPAVRLWYEETGQLSDNIIEAQEFYLWNTIIGEGSAEEQANDALFTIDLHSDGHQYISQPLTLIATDQDGKVFARRSFANLQAIDAGNVTVALWVPDVDALAR